MLTSLGESNIANISFTVIGENPLDFSPGG